MIIWCKIFDFKFCKLGVEMLNWTKNIAESDERFDCYNADDIVIFGVKVDDSEDVQINVYKDCMSEVINSKIIQKYLEWLGNCCDVVRAYLEETTGEELPDDWEEHIEIYSASITFISEEDYGATVSFGESIFEDHIIELEFEKEEIINNCLNG